MSAPAPNPGPRDLRDVTDRRARFHARAAWKLLADDKLDPRTAAIVHALLAVEARLEEQCWYLGDIADHTGFIG